MSSSAALPTAQILKVWTSDGDWGVDVCSVTAGRGGPQLRRYKPVCPPKPFDLAQQPKVLGGRISLPNLTPASSTSSISSCASLTSQSSNRHLLRRRNPVIPDTVKLPPGILSQSAASHPAQTGTPPGNRAFKHLVRRREQPGRRKDSTQSLYINSPECDLLLHFSSCPPSTSSSSISLVKHSPQHQNQETQASKGQRRFSDPDVPYMEADV